MRCYGEIEYKERTISIEPIPHYFATELRKDTIAIDRIISAWLICREVKQITIDRPTYKIIRVNVPVPFDFVILQNDYLPLKGEYFLN